MTLGRRREERQAEFWAAADGLGGPRNLFYYDRLNELPAEAGFDRKLEAAAEPYYERAGRRGPPPGVYFRMMFAFFEHISCRRGIAWRCEDSRPLARLLGFGPGEQTPDHSTLSLTRRRPLMEIHQAAFESALQAAQVYGLFQGGTIGVDTAGLTRLCNEF